MMHFHNRANVPTSQNRVRLIVWHIAMAIVFGAVFVGAFGYFVMLLWNAVMPHLFGLAHIDFWHSAGLLLLARILVGGFHPRGGVMSRHHGVKRRGSWQQYEEWWHEAGERSYRDYAGTRPSDT